MRFVAGRGAVAELLAGSAMAGLLAGSAMAKRMAALWQRAIGKSCWQGRRSGRDAAGLGAPQKTVESGHGNKLRQGKQPAGREHHREASKERAPALQANKKESGKTHSLKPALVMTDLVRVTGARPRGSSQLLLCSLELLW